MQKFIIRVVFLIFLFSFMFFRTAAFATPSCSSKLSNHSSIEYFVELYIRSTQSVSKSMQNLHAYLFYVNPILQPEDVEAIVEFIFKNNTLTYPEFKPSSIWNFFAHKIRKSTVNTNQNLVTIDDLSLESQILTWILEHYPPVHKSVDGAVMTGKAHKFILKDIRNLRPNQSDKYYRRSLGGLFI